MVVTVEPQNCSKVDYNLTSKWIQTIYYYTMHRLWDAQFSTGEQISAIASTIAVPSIQ
jgi:hypothetical protein